MKKYLITSAILSALAVAAFAQSNDAITKRQEIMTSNGKAMKALSSMAKGEMAFDATQAMDALTSINAGAKELTGLFPADSQTGTGVDNEPTEAAPAIWEKPDEFDAEIAKFIENTDMAVASAPTDAATVGQAVQMFAGDCKECHETFRIKKD